MSSHNVLARKRSVSYSVELLRQLIRIPSFTGKEQEICEYIHTEMKSLGLHVQTFDSGNKRLNVVGTIKGNAPTKGLMINGHVDTQAIVENWTKDPLGGAISDGRVYGVGSADQKAGVAAMIGAAKSIIEGEIRLKSDLLIAAVIGHMDGGRGTRTLVKNGVLAKYAIITEPSAMNLMVEGGGIVYLDIETTGRSAFTPQRYTGVSAILKMMKVINALEKLRMKYSSTKYIKRPYLNVGVIEGGIWPSIVPDRCKIRIDVRTLPTQKPTHVKLEVEQAIKALKKKDPELRATVSYNPTVIEHPRYSWSVKTSNRLVRTVSDSVRVISGRKVRFAGFQGWVDGGVLNKAGVPSIVYGPGDLDQIYAPDEHIRIEDLSLAQKVYELSAIELCA